MRINLDMFASWDLSLMRLTRVRSAAGCRQFIPCAQIVVADLSRNGQHLDHLNPAASRRP